MFFADGGAVRDAEQKLAGNHSEIWSGTDNSGLPVMPGIYLISVETENNKSMKKLVFGG